MAMSTIETNLSKADADRIASAERQLSDCYTIVEIEPYEETEFKFKFGK